MQRCRRVHGVGLVGLVGLAGLGCGGSPAHPQETRGAADGDAGSWHATGEVASSSDRMKPPRGTRWYDVRGDIALAGPVACCTDTAKFEVWNVVTKKRLGVVTGTTDVDHRDSPNCDRLSPLGTLVQCRAGRFHVWKRLDDTATSCREAIVGPDDATCMQVDGMTHEFRAETGPPALLYLKLCKTESSAPCTRITTIDRGLNRESGSEGVPIPRWWTVTYCSARVLVIDEGNARLVTDVATGEMLQRNKIPAGAPLDCKHFKGLAAD